MWNSRTHTVALLNVQNSYPGVEWEKSYPAARQNARCSVILQSVSDLARSKEAERKKLKGGKAVV